MPSRSLPLTLSPVLSRCVPVAIFLAFLGIAFWTGLRTTTGLKWPDVDPLAVSVDLYRDIALAQTILDGGYGPDPAYLGERSWYNPLGPAILAAVSRATGYPVHVVAVQIGAFANLLAPICFFIMCAVLFDRWTALYASAGFLFLLPGVLPSWLSATYSPWFLPVNFVQALFYLSVIALYRAERSGRVWAYLAPGLLWGLTFLGHTAPALIFGGMTTLGLALAMWSRRRERAVVRSALGGALVRYGVMIVAALAVSAPFVAIILGHYGLLIKNPAPGAYSDPLLARELPSLIWLHVAVPTLIALFGLWVLITRSFRPSARRLVLLWIATAAAFLAYAFLRLGAKLAGLTPPSIVPSFHFFFYLKAAAALLFGIGLVALGAIAAAFLTRRLGPRLSSQIGLDSQAAATLVCLVLLALQARTYFARPDFDAARRGSLAVAATDNPGVFEWLLAHRRPGDVALAAERDGSMLCAASGVKTVIAAPAFSNPYVDLQPRREARDRMYGALDRHDSAAFRELAKRYHVTLVLTRPGRSARYDARPPPDLELAFSFGGIRVYRVRPER